MAEDRIGSRPPVALIAPYPELAALATGICRDFKKSVEIQVGDLREGLEKAKNLMERGVEVMISRGGTAQLLKQELMIPIVEIQVTTYDILGALQKISKQARKIGIVGFENIVYGSHKLADLLNIDLMVFIVHKEEEVPGRVEEARKEKVDIIIGDNVVVSHANQLGYSSILIESGNESVLQSFHEAYRILEVVRSEAQKSREYLSTLNQLKAVLDSVEDQIVILDAEDRIQSCNPAALRIFKRDENQVKGVPLFLYPSHPLKEIKKKMIPERNFFADVQGKYVLLDYLPIETKGERIGTLLVGRSISKLQQAERKIRNELHLKGHVARYNFADIISEDKNFWRVINRAKRFSTSASTILIQGETGTGKEMFTQSIHNMKFGSDRPFVAVNCATLPETLLESELFGYAPGAFTGARSKGKKGLFELAHGGTLLLDEISELPLNLQSRLLRVIEEKEVKPIGDERVIPVEVRLIATTNKDLAREVKEKRFRGDLYYRLNVLQLNVPPLRERGGDSYVLFKHFILRAKPNCERKYLFSKEVERLLVEHPWPGNVRELRNFVERIEALTDDFEENLRNVSEWIREDLRKADETDEMTLEEQKNLSLRELESLLIKKMGESSHLKRSDLAKILGISRTTLWKRMRE